MCLGGVVHVGDENAPASSCKSHSGSHGREGGGEVGESRRESGPGVSDGEGDKLDSSPVSLEGGDEGEVLVGLGVKFGVAS